MTREQANQLLSEFYKKHTGLECSVDDSFFNYQYYDERGFHNGVPFFTLEWKTLPSFSESFDALALIFRLLHPNVWLKFEELLTPKRTIMFSAQRDLFLKGPADVALHLAIFLKGLEDVSRNTTNLP